ncbi:MBL fold metallo-hydrolase [Flavobacterium cellulosilyticum]|uniref:MBL fold metallo-hydrolase n=1 Tax=Flavobacterium cellulosilyticum TaxID=2541731 RepID=A0A4R5CH66_9FLAO|nr:MBL fold metallo-hydrolase [Flavobacterium cellulosilyticum]TDD97850.1 MBL fold metallo-hydrolase [Flavobacterium cellulosilyticum]
MEIKFYQAECGDAARIRFLGNDNKYHNVFIDAGYERTFRYALEIEIQEIINKGERIDLWIISHIHDDHIGGIIKYIDTINDGEYKDMVNQYFYNPPRSYVFKTSTKSASEFASIGQGDLLYEYLKSNNKLLNIDITSSLKPFELYGLNITILSPSSQKLDKLRLKYPLDSPKSFEREEDEKISEAVTTKQNDYKTLINDFVLDKWKEDVSVENGSSISILTEFNHKKILWLADSHPSDVIKSLNKIGFNSTNKLECEWVKVTHHGSKGNNNDALYDLIKCENYLFSVNGENKHYLPSKECIARILRNKKRSTNSKYKFHFTYDNETLRSIFKNENSNIYAEYNFEVVYGIEKYLKFDVV